MEWTLEWTDLPDRLIPSYLVIYQNVCSFRFECSCVATSILPGQIVCTLLGTVRLGLRLFMQPNKETTFTTLLVEQFPPQPDCIQQGTNHPSGDLIPGSEGRVTAISFFCIIPTCNNGSTIIIYCVKITLICCCTTKLCKITLLPGPQQVQIYSLPMQHGQQSWLEDKH